MANKYYTPSGEPVDLSRARAVQLRAEFASIEQGFARLQIDTDRAVKLRKGETVEILDAPSVRAGGVFAFDSSGKLVVFGKASDASRAGKILGWDATTGTLKYWDYASTITSPVNAAAASAASAAQSATNAAASASAAAQSEANAAVSAANAAASAAAAAQSKTDAATSATNAAASAAAAAQSEANAAVSATNAAASAASAAQSATNAAASATAAAASFGAFDARYLGAKASDPTTDNDGNALQVGALYWNTAANEMRVWDGSSWRVAAGSLVGNVTTATRLQTARTITIGNTGKSFDGSADVSWSLDEIGVTGFVTETGTQSLSNKTLVNPKLLLGGSNGTAGQVLMSQGAGLPPVWGSVGGLGSGGTFETGDILLTSRTLTAPD